MAHHFVYNVFINKQEIVTTILEALLFVTMVNNVVMFGTHV